MCHIRIRIRIRKIRSSTFGFGFGFGKLASLTFGFGFGKFGPIRIRIRKEIHIRSISTGYTLLCSPSLDDTPDSSRPTVRARCVHYELPGSATSATPTPTLLLARSHGTGFASRERHANTSAATGAFTPTWPQAPLAPRQHRRCYWRVHTELVSRVATQTQVLLLARSHRSHHERHIIYDMCGLG